MDRIIKQIGLNLSIEPDDFDYGEFFDRDGRVGAMRALGDKWLEAVDEVNTVLAANPNAYSR